MAQKNVEFHEEAAREFIAGVDWYIAQRTRGLTFCAASHKCCPDNRRSPSALAELLAPYPQVLPSPISLSSNLSGITNVIQVLAIAHAHRRPGYWKNRR
jgi:hypothetical protein